jgi:N-acyl-L-homoserine lactone synthetase
MGALVALPTPSFADSVLNLVEVVDYRRADTSREREEIFRLRYEAYREEDAIEPNAARRFCDRFDDLDNAYIFGVYYEGTLASSIRLNIATSEHPELPALNVFRDILMPDIEAGKVIVDPTRFVVDPKIARLVPKISYATVRLGWLACEFFDAQHGLATVRVEHQAFYKRLFGHQVLAEAREYPTLRKPISLMSLKFQEEKARVMRRYPFLRSSFFERRMLFGRGSSAPKPQAAQADAAAYIQEMSRVAETTQ